MSNDSRMKRKRASFYLENNPVLTKSYTYTRFVTAKSVFFSDNSILRDSGKYVSCSVSRYWTARLIYHKHHFDLEPR